VTDAAPVIDVDLVRGLLRSQARHWNELPVRAVADGGWSNRTFRLGDDLVVRLPSAQRYAAQIGKEHAWLPRLAPRLPLPIPAPRFLGRPGATFPFPWAVYDWIPGEPADEASTVGSVAIASELAAFLCALHGLEAKHGPAPGAHNFHRGGDLGVYDAEARAAFASLPPPFDPLRAAAVWDAALASSWKLPPVWLHGDVAAGNLLLRDGRLAAVIDFGNAAVGDPACDLVAAWTLFSGAARDAFMAALPYDEHTWARARGWAIWKASIVVTGHDPNRRNLAAGQAVLAALLAG
jgi:aminoglycoside phosphotransferase (APT) family kinase protein